MTEQKYRQRGYRDVERSERSGGSGPSDRPARLEGAPKGRGVGPNRSEVFRCKTCGEKNDPEIALDSLCRKCGSALHSCSQCRFFDGAARWQCRQEIPAPILAKSKANTCTFFAPTVAVDLTGTKAADTPDRARSAFDDLFGKR